jgi:TetR/AcrR family transcriptional repressor of nem operon
MTMVSSPESHGPVGHKHRDAGLRAQIPFSGCRAIIFRRLRAGGGKTMAVLSTMVGAVLLSRAVNDPDLAQAFLDAATDQVREAVAA